MITTVLGSRGYDPLRAAPTSVATSSSLPRSKLLQSLAQQEAPLRAGQSASPDKKLRGDYFLSFFFSCTKKNDECFVRYRINVLPISTK